MYIQINTANQVQGGRDRRHASLEDQIRQRLARFESRITDVEVHVSEDFDRRAGSGLRCTLEARVKGVPPVAVAEHGATVDHAILGAARKAARALDHQLGKLSDRKGH